MKTSTKLFVATTFMLLLLASFAVPLLTAKPSKPQTQYILEVGWTSSNDYWYLYVIQYGNKPATLQLSAYSQDIGIETFSVEKTLTLRDSFHWGARHTTLSVAVEYEGSLHRLYIDFWATEKPSHDTGSRGDWTTAAGIANINFLGNRNIRSTSATVISWTEPR